MNFMDEIRKFCREKLKSVETRVQTADGRNFVERKDASGQTNVHLSDGGGLGFVHDKKPDLQVATVLPGLSLGSQDVAYEFGLLRRHGVTHILNVASGISNPFESSFSYLKVELLDLPHEDVRAVFDRCFAFIDGAVGGAGQCSQPAGHVFVHCNAGVSRSATLVIAYLMSRRHLHYDAALAAVRAVRSVVRPNDGFVRQLLEYERELFCQEDVGGNQPQVAHRQ